MSDTKIQLKPEPSEGHVPAAKTSGTSPTTDQSSVPQELCQAEGGDGPAIPAAVETSRPAPPGRTIIAIIPAKDWYSMVGPLPVDESMTLRQPLTAWALVEEPDGQRRMVGVCANRLVDERPCFIGYDHDSDPNITKRIIRKFYLPIEDRPFGFDGGDQ